MSDPVADAINRVANEVARLADQLGEVREKVGGLTSDMQSSQRQRADLYDQIGKWGTSAVATESALQSLVKDLTEAKAELIILRPLPARLREVEVEQDEHDNRLAALEKAAVKSKAAWAMAAKLVTGGAGVAAALAAAGWAIAERYHLFGPKS